MRSGLSLRLLLILSDLPEEYFKHLANLITYATILFNLLYEDKRQLKSAMKFFTGGQEKVVAVQA